VAKLPAMVRHHPGDEVSAAELAGGQGGGYGRIGLFSSARSLANGSAASALASVAVMRSSSAASVQMRSRFAIIGRSVAGKATCHSATRCRRVVDFTCPASLVVLRYGFPGVVLIYVCYFIKKTIGQLAKLRAFEPGPRADVLIEPAGA
jgi:hypothetical protein